MSKILFINSVCNGSTGTICKTLYKAAVEEGHECCIAYGRGEAPKGFKTIKIGNKLDIYLHVLKARLFDASGFGSKHATKEFIKKIDEFKPDIIHLHNIHGYYVNIEILFKYLKDRPEIKKIWTLHDCWAFTGHCPHFEYEKCQQWKNECKKCIRRNEYPKSLIDRCNRNYWLKKSTFTNVDNLMLVSPSNWLMNLIKDSFFKEYPIEVINNGVDTSIFKHTESNIKERYGIKNKKVILGVASVWDKKKGLDTFIELSKQLDNEYQIVLIGLNKKQIKKLPSNIIGITRTENVEELVKWYSAAEVFFNPTLEDNYPTVNLEAIACETPVVTFNTGGSPESGYYGKCILNNNKLIFKEIKNINTLNDLVKKNISLKYMNKYYLLLYEVN
ncbi:glycosyltransferase [Thomasclavelia spiroformis]|mgnify:FL=1|uniref:Glycosyltransferase n=2 Tax=Thomasclavelia spiroformis TaxID=29348 RepID=A0A921GBF7_9FIRM|nr:glycosyltransferase [Thomasclavelia spiroformis]HJF40519.1 glycosyltransferase [Thomasclavelia spiroformis]